MEEKFLTRRYGSPRFYELLDLMAKTHSDKNHDYAEEDDPFSNFKEVATATGVDPFTVVRMHIANKNARIKQLSSKPNFVEGEGIKDSLLDLAVYALIGYAILEDTPNPSQSPTLTNMLK